MHFLSLAVLGIPEVQEDKERDREIAEALEELRIQKELKGRSIQTGLLMERLRGLLSAFSRTVDSCVSDLLYPYYESIPDTSYLEFDDRTEQLLAEYEGTADCVRLAQGTVVELFSYMLHGRFIIRDGKVFQRDAGPLRHEKRTKKAKRMKALPDYPLRKVYRDFKDYAENECGFTFDEEHQGYGFYYNPNAMWDWYSIGGRWPEMFLVKDTCEEYSLGERSWCNEDEELEAPEGYLWVCAARKKDIAWEEMRKWREKKARERFSKLEKMFATGRKEEGFRGAITPQGILCCGEMVYFKDETVEDYLNRNDILDHRKYPVYVHDIVDAGNWFSREDFEWINDGAVPVDWPERIDGYIDNLGDEDVLVGVDYHI